MGGCEYFGKGERGGLGGPVGGMDLRFVILDVLRPSADGMKGMVDGSDEWDF